MFQTLNTLSPFNKIFASPENVQRQVIKTQVTGQAVVGGNRRGPQKFTFSATDQSIVRKTSSRRIKSTLAAEDLETLKQSASSVA